VTPVLVDSSFLIALYDTTDFDHGRCIRAYESIPNPFATCEAVITESVYMLRYVDGASQALLTSVECDALEIPFQLSGAITSVKSIMLKYADTPCDFADACLIHMADQLNTGDILTLDSDFKHYRWRRNRHFRMLIPME
jgi:predicted nucleic acid-binding protein